MKLSALIQRLRGQSKKEESAKDERAEEVQSTVRTAPSPEPPARKPPEPEQKPAPDNDEPLDLASVREEFRAIQEMLGDEQGVVELPARVLLANLPEELRGEAWRADQFPDATLQVDQTELLEKLVRGRVTFPLHAFLDDLPEGWVRGDPDTEVELSLAEVVMTIPSELLQTGNRPSEAVEKASAMRDFFHPTEDSTQSSTRETAQTAEAEPASSEDVAEHVKPEEPAVKPRPSTRKKRTPIRAAGWDGIERSIDASPNGVDINTASVEDLVGLPGVGTSRAETIVTYRATHGGFESIFDLASIPGIGRSVFRRMTGLSLKGSTKRHDKLNQLLGENAGKQLSLREIVEKLPEALRGTGAILTNREGISLAASGEAVEQADFYAALSSRLIQRNRKYMDRLAGSGADCMLLPASNPPLLLLNGYNVTIVLTLKQTSVPGRIVSRARSVAREVEWLMERRAVVRQI